MNTDLFYQRNPAGHKGDHGKVLVIAGSSTYPGAALLTALGAVATGVDLIYLATPKAQQFVTQCPQLIPLSLQNNALSEQDLPVLQAYAEKVDTIVIGPGLSRDGGVMNAVRSFLLHNTKPVIIDADALYAIKYAHVHDVILTPHKNEFSMLFEREASDINVQHFASKDIVILCKCQQDFISDGVQSITNTTGHVSMTKGGTGDVLAGLTAGFLALSQNKVASAHAAAYFNGLAGEQLFKEQGWGWFTHDLPQTVSLLVKQKSI